MTLNESASAVVSLVFAVLTFSSMQIFKLQFQSSQGGTILGGLTGSLIFVFLLTTLNNLERVIFGKGFQAKWFEVGLSLVMAVMASAAVHRVSASTCFLFSLGMLYGMAKIAQDAYGLGSVGSSGHAHHDKGKKKK
ncbi:hypothetical protein TCAL_00411 [Tigriopus californicus]|uniref:Uncharacterized protein n=1 Tax=Tigriopus californicus TaxID=6832 RepID=A0A553NDP9_TIGCA|nr:keratinocyte-associated protein 2-like [Tigriopus californicus]TRY63574.1 hypothetical protein TCAL_00411 [Tigriopus californicus]|eukprot:TCALIF_00411-PA protein Name:"Similar to AAEL007634 Protein KRTCAP2 homolog (Aedes aegypti)" AED:0.01 eAED:0.01 QI:0/-1/0/1/-1/1/1/0/135